MKDLRNDKPNHDSFINEIEGHCLKCISRNKRKDKYARHLPSPCPLEGFAAMYLL